MDKGICSDYKIANSNYPKTSYYVDLAILIIFSIVMGISLPMWFLFKRKYLRLKKRSTILTSFIVIGNVFWLVCVPGRSIIGRHIFNCDWLLFLFIFHLPLVLIPIVVKLFSFRNKLLYSQIKANLAIERQLKKGEDLSKEHVKYIHDMKEYFVYIFSLLLSIVPYATTATSTSSTFKRGRSLSHLRKEDFGSITEGEIAAARFSRTWVFVVLLFIAVLFPFIIAIALRMGLTPHLTHGCIGCGFELPELLSLIILGFLVTIPTFFFSRDYESELDPLKMAHEVHFSISFLAPCLIISYILALIDPASLMSQDNSVNWLWVGFPGLFLSYIIQVPYQIYMSATSKKRTHSTFGRFDGTLTDLSSGDEPDIEEILSSDKMTEALQKHLTAEFSVENLVFLLQVRLWRSSYDNVSELDRDVKAQEIFRTFIPVNSALEINIPESVRRPIEMIFKKNETSINKNVFNFAEAEVKNLLVTDSLPRFFRSEIFQRVKQDKSTRRTVVKALRSAAGSLRDQSKGSRSDSVQRDSTKSRKETASVTADKSEIPVKIASFSQPLVLSAPNETAKPASSRNLARVASTDI